MTRLSRACSCVLVAVAMVTGFAAPANAAPAEDFVVGAGVIEIPHPLVPGARLQIDISVDAHSGASGEDPTGTVLVTLPVAGLTLYSGPVTCLVVTANTAFVGIEDPVTGPVIFEVVDNGATGAPDTIGLIDADVPGCAPGFHPVPDPLVAGDLEVHDSLPLTSKDQCKHGGWVNLTDDVGQPFASQGQCIAFVQPTSG